VEVLNSPPRIVWLGPDSMLEGDTVTVTAEAVDADGDALVYQWDLNYDPANPAEPFQPAPNLVGDRIVLSPSELADLRVADDARLRIAVRAWDGEAAGEILARTVTVGNVAPYDLTAISFRINGVDEPPAGTVHLYEGGLLEVAGAFADPGEDTWRAEVQYAGPGTPPEQDVRVPALLDAVGRTFRFAKAFGVPGLYDVTVTVRDDDGVSGSMGFQVEVTNVPPEVRVGGVGVANEGEAFARTVEILDPPPGSWDVAVDWGDGTGAEVLQGVRSRLVEIRHSYGPGAPGNCRVTVTATDDAGSDSVPAGFDVRINKRPAVAQGVGDLTVAEDASSLVRVADLAAIFDDPDNLDAELAYAVCLRPVYTVQGASLNGDHDTVVTVAETIPRNASGGAVTALNDRGVWYAVRSIDPAARAITLGGDHVATFDAPGLRIVLAGGTNVIVGGLARADLSAHGRLDLRLLPDASGEAAVFLGAADPHGAAAETFFLLTVEPRNDPPRVVTPIADLGVNPGAAPAVGFASLEAVFADVDNADEELTFSIAGNSVADLVTAVIREADPDSGKLTHWLDLSFAAGKQGVAQITVRAADPQGLFADARFLVMVAAAVPIGALARPDTFRLDEDGGTAVLDVLANDWCLPYPREEMRITGVIQPAHGRAAVVAGGTSLTYAPLAGYYGTDAFTYTITDAHGGTSTAAVALTVTALTPLPGDANLDRAVNCLDYIAFKRGCLTGTTWGEGDFDRNGTVDRHDFLILKENIGKSVGAGGAGALSGAASSSADGAPVVADAPAVASSAESPAAEPAPPAATVDALRPAAVAPQEAAPIAAMAQPRFPEKWRPGTMRRRSPLPTPIRAGVPLGLRSADALRQAARRSKALGYREPAQIAPTETEAHTGGASSPWLGTDLPDVLASPGLLRLELPRL
jgi:hypothetical protein